MINALNYIFSVVLKHDFEVVGGTTSAQERFGNGRPKDAVFVYLPGHCAEEIELISLAKSLNPAPVVIALQPVDGGFGARAFLAGADDVVDWPCCLHELAVRFFVRLGRPLDPKALPSENVNWETEAYIAERAGLTTSEAQVMRVLYTHDGEIVSRDDLSLAVDARPWRYGDRKFDVHVGKIRKKLSDTFGSRVSVSTIRSLGYCLKTSGADIFSQN